MTNVCPDPKFSSSQNNQKLLLQQQQERQTNIILDNSTNELSGIISNNPTNGSSSIILEKPTYGFSDIDIILDTFSKEMTSSLTSSNVLGIILEKFGTESFYPAYATYSAFTKNSRETYPSFNVSYPYLSNRMSETPVFTPIEYAEYLNEYSLSPSSSVALMEQKPTNALEQIDAFYATNLSSAHVGSICALMPAAFGIIGNFFDNIDSIDNFLLNTNDKGLVSLLNTFKTNLINLINAIVKSTENKIKNFKLEDLVTGIATSLGNQAVLKEIFRLKEEALAFFTEENMQQIQKKIENTIDYAVSIFQNPTMEEIQFLLYRFCKLASSIEFAIEAIQDPLTDSRSNYDSTLKMLAASSNQNTAMAIRAGALRNREYNRRIGINSAYGNFYASGNIRPFAPSEFDRITQWNNGNGDSRVGFAGQWIQMLGAEGWIRVNAEPRGLLMRVQDRWNKRIIVNSGYRSPSYNDYVGGVSNSEHLNGNALDVSWDGFDIASREEFIEIASEEGFRGIGRYDNFVHMDIGRRRSWVG